METTPHPPIDGFIQGEDIAAKALEALAMLGAKVEDELENIAQAARFGQRVDRVRFDCLAPLSREYDLLLRSMYRGDLKDSGILLKHYADAVAAALGEPVDYLESLAAQEDALANACECIRLLPGLSDDRYAGHFNPGHALRRTLLQ